VRRVAVIGSGAGGKTTLARAPAARLGVPHREVDAVVFRPDWSRAPEAEIVRTLDRWLDDDGWVIDGPARSRASGGGWTRPTRSSGSTCRFASTSRAPFAAAAGRRSA
jgi:hypothetical protein